MKYFYLFLLSSFTLSVAAKSKIDTITIRDTLYADNINQISLKYKEDYLTFYKELLDQKQQQYDSLLNTLNFSLTAFGILFTILIAVGFIRTEVQIRNLKKNHEKKLDDHKNLIIGDLNKYIDQIIKEKMLAPYAEDVNDLQNNAANIDRILRDICDSYILKAGHQRPDLNQLKNPLRNSKNPFNQEDKNGK